MEDSDATPMHSYEKESRITNQNTQHSTKTQGAAKTTITEYDSDLEE